MSLHPVYPACPGEKSWGDICLYDGAYRVGERWFSTSSSVRVHSKCGGALTYLLEHLGERVSEEVLKGVMRSDNPLPTLVTTLEPKLFHSKTHLLIVRQSAKNGRYAALIDLNNPDLASRIKEY